MMEIMTNDENEGEEQERRRRCMDRCEIALPDRRVCGLGRRRSRSMTTAMAMIVVAIAMATFSLLVAVSYRHEPSSHRNRNRLSRRNPFQVPRRNLQEENDSPGGRLRYLSFGGASTWGVGLTAEAEGAATATAAATAFSPHEAYPYPYPYRLSPEVHNLAQRHGEGPTLAALCTQSLVQNHTYDVVTLEFSQTAHRESDLVALELLARRLRRRFPQALLVLVQLWSPAHYSFLQDENEQGKKVVDFATWRRGRRQQLNADDEDWSWESFDWQHHLHEMEWTYSPEVTRASQRIQDLATQVQGQFVHLAPPQDPLHGLETAHTWFLEVPAESAVPQYTLSSKGHMVVANHIRSVVDQANVGGKLQKKQQQQQQQQLGDWGSGDQCQLWLDYDPKGESAASMIPRHSSSLVLRTFGGDSTGSHDQYKYALEVSVSSNQKGGGSLVVKNPFDEDRMLYLTYMTSVSGNKFQYYPPVQVQLFQHNQPLKKGTGVVVDPYYNYNEDDENENENQDPSMDSYPYHATRTTAIGNVPAHTAVEVRLQSLPLHATATANTNTNTHTVAPFRLVGASFLAKEKVEWQIATEFDLAPERVLEKGRGRRHRLKRTRGW